MIVAAIRAMLTALSAAMLVSAAYSTAPTGSQITLLLVGSVLAGCLAVSWVAVCHEAQKKSPKSIRNMDSLMLRVDMLAGRLAVSPIEKKLPVCMETMTTLFVPTHIKKSAPTSVR
jgi:hypothetical protein